MPTWGEILKELATLMPGGGGPPQGPSPFDIVRRKYLKQLHDRTGRCVIVYATKWTQPGAPPDAVSITPEDMEGFMEVVHGLPGDSLDLVLHSPGGSAEVAESLVIYLRSKFRDVRVIVPHAAMSAASMLACSAERIVMGKHSFLGPIDPQLAVPVGGGGGVMLVPAHAIREQFEMAKKECKADPSLLPCWLPILQQYGPALIVKCQLLHELSQSLVTEWLSKYMFQGQPDAEKRAKKIAEALAAHGTFKTHGRFLSRDYVKNLGLVVEDLEADQQLQDAVLSVFHATQHTLGATNTVKLIENHEGKAYIRQFMLALPPPFAMQLGPQPGPPPGPPAGPAPKN